MHLPSPVVRSRACATLVARAAANLAAASRLAALALAALAALAGAPALAQPDPEDLRRLAELLDKPSVRDWLRERSREDASPSTPRSSPATAHEAMASRLDETRTFLRALAATAPELPARLDVARARLSSELREREAAAILGPLAAFAALGFLVETLFWRATSSLRRRMIASALDTVEGRLRTLGWRALYGVGVVGAFALGSVGAFLLVDWPPLLQRIVLAYLLAFLAVRLTLVLGRVVLAPGAERFRVLALATPAARYWFVRSALLVGAFAT